MATGAHGRSQTGSEIASHEFIQIIFVYANRFQHRFRHVARSFFEMRCDDEGSNRETRYIGSNALARVVAHLRHAIDDDQYAAPPQQRLEEGVGDRRDVDQLLEVAADRLHERVTTWGDLEIQLPFDRRSTAVGSAWGILVAQQPISAGGGER